MDARHNAIALVLTLFGIPACVAGPLWNALRSCRLAHVEALSYSVEKAARGSQTSTERTLRLLLSRYSPQAICGAIEHCVESHHVPRAIASEAEEGILRATRCDGRWR